MLSLRSGLADAAVVVTFLEELGAGEAGLAAGQSGTMVHPIKKSNVETAARRRNRDEEEQMRFCINGEVVTPIGGIERRQH